MSAPERTFTPRKLTLIAADCIVTHAAGALTAEVLASLPQEMAMLLLLLVMKRMKLTYPRAKAFQECGHEAVVQHIAKLDLYSGILPATGGGCRD